MSIIQSSPSPDTTAIEAASRTNLITFGIYVGLLILSGLFTVLLFRSSNRVQDAIRADALLKIEAVKEAGKEAQRLSEEKIAELNRGTEELKNKNLLLEAEVLKLREKMADRHLTSVQQSTLAGKLKPFAGVRATIYVYSGESEIATFARELIAPLADPKGAAWKVSVALESPRRPIPGVLIEYRTTANEAARGAAAVLASELSREGIAAVGPQPIGATEAHIVVGGRDDSEAPIIITVGKKP